MNTNTALDATPTIGLEGAAAHAEFIGAYQIVQTERGVVVTPSPDGRTVGACERCWTCIHNIYVFRAEGGTTMHVGIDCASKMGLPAEEVRRARGHFRAVARAERMALARDAERISREERTRREAAERAANLAANAAAVDELDALAANPSATDYERRVLTECRQMIAAEGGDWLDEVDSPREIRLAFGDGGFTRAANAVRKRVQLASIRTRIALCATSREVAEPTTKSGKPSGFRAVLRAYRHAIVLNGAYGTTFINFLTDDKGNAYVHKGSRVVHYGETIEATWSIEGVDTRDGLTATVLKRPRKVALTAEEAEMAAH